MTTLLALSNSHWRVTPPSAIAARTSERRSECTDRSSTHSRHSARECESTRTKSQSVDLRLFTDERLGAQIHFAAQLGPHFGHVLPQRAHSEALVVDDAPVAGACSERCGAARGACQISTERSCRSQPRQQNSTHDRRCSGIIMRISTAATK